MRYSAAFHIYVDISSSSGWLGLGGGRSIRNCLKVATKLWEMAKTACKGQTRAPLS